MISSVKVQSETNYTNLILPNINKIQFNLQHIDSNFEIASRTFYATINKISRQNSPSNSKRKSGPYSFLENWYLHKMYSKSQQTLIGISPIKPTVILSGDEDMFTPPFNAESVVEEDEEEEEEEEEEDSYYDNYDEPYYNLSSFHESNMYDNQYDDLSADYNFDDYSYHNRQDIISLPASYLSPSPFETSIPPFSIKTKMYNPHPLNHDISSLSILIPSDYDQFLDFIELSLEEPELSPCSSLDEQESIEDDESFVVICSDQAKFLNTIQPSITKPVIHSYPTQTSVFDDSASIMSYQSLDDLLQPNRTNYGSISKKQSTLQPKISVSHDNNETESITIWNRVFVYIMYLWQVLIFYAETCFGYFSKLLSSPFKTSLQERQTLL